MQPPDRLDEDKERADASWCEQHQRMEDSEAHDLARQDEYESEPDYEQIIEDRAYMRGRDPEAVMWGGEDIPS